MWTNVLCMGQRNACQRTSDAVMYIHGERGHRGAPYLDDLIRVSPLDIINEGYEDLMPPHCCTMLTCQPTNTKCYEQFSCNMEFFAHPETTLLSRRNSITHLLLALS